MTLLKQIFSPDRLLFQQVIDAFFCQRPLPFFFAVVDSIQMKTKQLFVSFFILKSRPWLDDLEVHHNDSYLMSLLLEVFLYCKKNIINAVLNVTNGCTVDIYISVQTKA